MNPTIDWITSLADAERAKRRPELASWLRALPQDATLSTTDVASALGISDEHVRGWIEEGALPAADFRAAGASVPYYRIRRDQLAAFLETRINNPAK